MTVYSRYDFGDTLPDGTTGEPYMQLLSQVDSAKAIAQVTTIRGKTMSTLPPEIDATTLVDFLKSGNIGPTPTTTDVIGGPTTAAAGGNKLSKAGSLAANQTDDDIHNFTIDRETVKKYGLIVVCLLGANVLIGLVLVVFAVFGCVRRGSSRKTAATRTVSPHYAPVKNLDHDEVFDAPSYSAKSYSQ